MESERMIEKLSETWNILHIIMCTHSDSEQFECEFFARCFVVANGLRASFVSVYYRLSQRRIAATAHVRMRTFVCILSLYANVVRCEAASNDLLP